MKEAEDSDTLAAWRLAEENLAAKRPPDDVPRLSRILLWVAERLAALAGVLANLAGRIANRRRRA